MRRQRKSPVHRSRSARLTTAPRPRAVRVSRAAQLRAPVARQLARRNPFPALCAAAFSVRRSLPYFLGAAGDPPAAGAAEAPWTAGAEAPPVAGAAPTDLTSFNECD